MFESDMLLSICRILTVLLMVNAQQALAEDCVVKDHAIVEEMQHDRDLTQRWAMIFGIGFSVATVGQLAAASTSPDHESAIDWYWGALGSALGLVPTLISPPAVLDDSRKLRGSGSCKDVYADQILLVHAAENEGEMTGLTFHLENVAVNLGISLILGIGYQHWDAARMNFLLGFPVGELMILTQPKGSLRFRNSNILLSLAPLFSLNPNGLLVTISY